MSSSSDSACSPPEVKKSKPSDINAAAVTVISSTTIIADSNQMADQIGATISEHVTLEV